MKMKPRRTRRVLKANRANLSLEDTEQRIQRPLLVGGHVPDATLRYGNTTSGQNILEFEFELETGGNVLE